MTSASDLNRKLFNKDYFPQQADVLNIVLDNIAQGMVVVGPDYRTLAFNRHFEDMFQLPPGTIAVGVDFREILKKWALVTGQDRQMLDSAIQQLDKPVSFELEFPRLIKGELRWCRLIHNPLPDKGCVRTFTDITERKQAEKQLVSSLTGKTVMLKEIHHRVKNNMQVISSLKYAFPEGRKGTVRVGISKNSEGNNVLTAADNGIGFPASIDFYHTTSLGLRLVNLLTGQLRGTVELAVDGGTKVSITFPGSRSN